MVRNTNDKRNKTAKSGNKNLKWSLPLPFVFVLPCILISVLYLQFKDIYFPGTSRMHDLIIDQIAMDGSNKTGEWEFFWGLLWLGCFCILGLFLMGRSFLGSTAGKCGSELPSAHDTSSWDFTSSFEKVPLPLICVLCFFPPVIQLICYGKVSLSLWLFALTFSLLMFIFKKDCGKCISLFLFLYFDVHVINLIAAFVIGKYLHSDLLIFAAGAVIFSFALIFYFHFYGVFDKIFFASQLPLPLLLILYLKHSYRYQEQILQLHHPKSYIIFIAFFMLALYIGFFLQYYFFRKSDKSIQPFIAAASAISIFLYGSYIPAALIIPSDMHHYGEQMIPWQQIVSLGNSPYKDYAPVSGLFPMPTGGINQLFFGGKASTYGAAFVILFILFGTLTVCMISLHVNGKWTLLFAFLFHMPVYCRTWIILPVLLLLLLPSVIHNKRRFLYLYVFCGFLSGLYYPLFGLALIVAGMPYALVCFFSYLKDKEFLTEIKKKSFYVETLILLVPIILSIPLLIKMASHILTYSHQTLLADGLSLSSISVPQWFLPYLSSFEQIRSGAYYALRFLGCMLPVWLFLLLLLSFYYQNKEKKPYKEPAFLGLSAGFLILPVCYTYTLVVMDETWVSRLFSRSSHIFLWIIGIFLPILLIRFGKQIFQKEASVALLTAFSLSVPFLTFYQMGDYQFPALDGRTNAECACVGEYTANLSPFPVSPSFVPISEEDAARFPALGYGFMESGVREQLYTYDERLEILHKADEDLKLLALDKLQMYYFLLNESALYSGKVSLAKSHEAAEAVIALLDEHTVAGNDLSPLNNYYIYRELIKRGYVYDSITEFYLPKTLYVSIYGEESYAATSLSDSPWAAPLYMSKCALSLGHNLENLSASVLIASDTPSEFLYVEIDIAALNTRFGGTLNEDTIMTISWEGKSCLLTDLGDGVLLLPLASNADWATGGYDQVFISLYDETRPVMEMDDKIPLEELSNCLQYYSLREDAGI